MTIVRVLMRAKQTVIQDRGVSAARLVTHSAGRWGNR